MDENRNRTQQEVVEKWEVWECAVEGRSDGNPFTDYEVSADIIMGNDTIHIQGFYDGDGVYRVRYMPSREGECRYVIRGNALLESTNSEISGSFRVVAPTGEHNHGPVSVTNQCYLQYADNSPYHSIGTTCYAWLHQSEALQEQTLQTLANSSFNKIRFCMFPKFYQYNEREPLTYPYERGVKRGQDPAKTKDKIEAGFYTEKQILDIRDFDCHTFNVEHFRRFDRQIARLAKLGIEADIILFHPYDKWGFATMDRGCNEQYLRYMVARYSAYRNVWWSMANEYDILNGMGWTNEEWSHYGRLITTLDPYHHLCSIHNCIDFFDYKEEWITHCSMQRQDLYKHVELSDQYRRLYGKPVVWDEIVYEGNIDQGWGNISGEEMVRRFWEATLRGGYAGHGETFVHPQDILWWSHGGVLHGESAPRFTFLKQIWDETPGGNLKLGGSNFDEVVGIPADQDKQFSWTSQTWADYEIHYYGFGRPSFKYFEFPEGVRYRIEVIDTWNMTIEDRGIACGHTKVELPARQWMAIRLIRQ